VIADGEPTAAQQLADPRFELVQQLLEYKKFKDAATALETQHRQQEADIRLPAAAGMARPTNRRRWIWTKCRCGICSRPSIG
jgi:chromatin segregation and condensation protein Rec8/ScpA/Scc1 (kleisin family)